MNAKQAREKAESINNCWRPTSTKMREMEEFVREQASKGCFKAQWMDQKLETVQEAVEVFSSAGFEVTEQETRRGRILTIDWSNA